MKRQVFIGETEINELREALSWDTIYRARGTAYIRLILGLILE